MVGPRVMSCVVAAAVTLLCACAGTLPPPGKVRAAPIDLESLVFAVDEVVLANPAMGDYYREGMVDALRAAGYRVVGMEDSPDVVVHGGTGAYTPVAFQFRFEHLAAAIVEMPGPRGTYDCRGDACIRAIAVHVSNDVVNRLAFDQTMVAYADEHAFVTTKLLVVADDAEASDTYDALASSAYTIGNITPLSQPEKRQEFMGKALEEAGVAFGRGSHSGRTLEVAARASCELGDAEHAREYASQLPADVYKSVWRQCRARRTPLPVSP